MLAIYVLFWAFSVFLVLPWGVRTTHEVGGEHVAGQAESAPHDFRLGRIAVRVTISDWPISGSVNSRFRAAAAAAKAGTPGVTS